MSSRQHQAIDAPHDIFVISDLHLGDRSAKDRFVLAGKEKLLNGFLDHVQREEGKLIIGGDLFELWRYTLDQVTHQWQDLLQRFQEMGALFIPGNHDAMSDVLYDLGEHTLRIWHQLTRNDRHSIHRDLCLPQEHAASYSIRVQKMLSRFLMHRERSQYDLAVVGHTHKPGQFGRWYYNSGSWTRPANNFLKIWPDGHAQVFDWTQQGERANDTLIWNQPNCQQSRDAA